MGFLKHAKGPALRRADSATIRSKQGHALVLQKQGDLDSGVRGKNDARARIAPEHPRPPDFNVACWGGFWPVCPLAKQMTLYVNPAGPQLRNIEIEGTGGLAVNWPRHLLGVIFFANTGTPKRGVGLYKRPRG